MIAIVTSCINPGKSSDLQKSFFSLEEREIQTIFTLKSLQRVGFSKIIIVDNSKVYDFTKIKAAVNDIDIIHLHQYQFENKGINELLMLLSTIELLPNHTPIFKISGRYYPNENFILEIDKNVDFKFKSYQFLTKRGTISTRGYFVKDKMIFENFLVQTLSEVFVYRHRAVGFRSFIDLLIGIFKPKFFTSFGTSIEFAAARVIKMNNYTYSTVEVMGVEGQVAGFKEVPKIKE